jgi:hypothetical protein
MALPLQEVGIFLGKAGCFARKCRGWKTSAYPRK